MVTSCSVHLCTNRHSTNGARKIHFFSFPLKDTERNELWIKAVGRKEFIPSKYSKVCSDHFVQTDFQQVVGGISYKLKLNSNAVPSIFPSYPKHVSQLKIPKLEVIEPITPDSTPLSNSTNLTSSTIIPSSNNPDLSITPEKSVICLRPLFVASPIHKKHSALEFELRVEIKRLQQKIWRQNNTLNNLKDQLKDLKKNILYKIKRRDENQILPPTQNLVVDNDFKQTIKESDLNTKTNEDIKNKLETIYGMVNLAQLEETDTTYIIKQCNNIISKLTNNKSFKEITTNGSNKRKIEQQERFVSKKKFSSQQHILSSLESKHTRQSFLNINEETLNTSTSATFDHSYI